jgi:hypothetical protein
MIESRKNRRKRRPAFAPLMALMILGAVSAPSKLVAEEPNQGAGDATPAPDKPSNGEYIGTETLEACMARWDEGTHMTRDAWRQSCDRIQRERSPYVKSR